ncbi:NAD-P-binding protein [Artomyces pyxidatus]|uniref:NAD-P-binding protein n=1 Tax=Artomyces pyxidatus TaxID=48021 RepID=A0ACB8TFI6_9AGAM|nr:NAD-P-binding protein [Artomyces pyxidatus]
MGFLFSRPTYDPSCDVPDLHLKVAIVTGADSGIGFETAQQLAIHGAKVYLACITMSAALGAISRIQEFAPSLRGQEKLVPLEVDLSSIHCAKAAAEEVMSREKRLDILVNNAGRMASEYVLTPEGIEQTVAVNHIGHFVFTQTLLPLLKETASLPDADVRIVAVSPGPYKLVRGSEFGSLADLNDLRGTPGRENTWISKYRRYGASKLMIILTTGELQRRLDAENIPITVMVVHPGGVATPAAKRHTPVIIHPYIWLAALTPYQGAFTSLFAATSPKVSDDREKYKGQYLEPYGEIGKLTTKESLDSTLARRLWTTTEAVVQRVLEVV